MGPKAGLDRCGKSLPLPLVFDPRTVQPIASRYTDSAIPAHVLSDQGTKVVCFLGVTTHCGCIFHSPVAGFSLLEFEVS